MFENFATTAEERCNIQKCEKITECLSSLTMLTLLLI